MRRTRFDDWPCPIARTTDLIGDWWTPLVMREAFLGRRRFEEFSEALGAPRAVLTARLKRLCDEGMLQRVAYQERPARFEYHLTDKGRAFWDVLAAMWRWGTDWLWEGDTEDPPLVLKDRDTGAVVQPVVIDEHSGERLDIRRLRVGRARRP
jgi:DNA-binding HxlR family transcriptional regulator